VKTLAVASAARRRVLGMAATIVAFEGAWFACVLGAAHGQPWAGTLVAVAVVAGFVALGDRPRVDAGLVAVALAIGLVWDSAMAQSGWIAYAEPGRLPALAPAWILALWALFAAVLRVPMRWLHARLSAAALLGAVGGPLSYAAAARMGAIAMPEPTRALLALAVGWAVIAPLLLAIARRWDAR
jgi:hypothetical protein